MRKSAGQMHFAYIQTIRPLRLDKSQATIQLVAWWLLAHVCLCLTYASQLAVAETTGAELLGAPHSSQTTTSSTKIAEDFRTNSASWTKFKPSEATARNTSLRTGAKERRRSLKRRRRTRKLATTSTGGDQDNGRQVMQQLDDKDNSRDKALASLLVHQLSDLIMNNQPEVIRQRLAGIETSDRSRDGATPPRSELGAEDHEVLDEDNNLEEATAAAPTAMLEEDEDDEEENEDEEDEEDEDEDDEEEERNDEEEKRAEEENLLNKMARRQAPGRELKRRQADELEATKSWPWSWFGGSGGSPASAIGSEALIGQPNEGTLTSQANCPSDIEDQIMSMEANLNELVQSGANLSIEQRQQLLSGADMSGSLQISNLTENQRQLALQIQQQVQQLAPCYQVMAPATIATIGSSSDPRPTILFITKVLTPILFSFIIVIGLVGNITVICVILEDKKYERGDWTPANMLILDLSLADLSFIVFCIPFTGWDYAVGHWMFGATWCKANQYLIVVCALSSIYNLVLMSCDRYMAIVYPIECINYRTSRNVFRAIAIKWAAILLLALPTIPMHGLIPLVNEDAPMDQSQPTIIGTSSSSNPLDSQQQRQPEMPQQNFSCRFLSEFYNPVTFQIVFFITSFFLPLVLIFFLYLGLLRRLWCGRRPRGHKESTKALDQKKKITRMVAKIVIFFAVCWCPIQVMLILMRLKSFPITATYVSIQVAAHILGYMNSCVNPYIYVFSTDSFYQSWKRSRFGRFCLFWFCCNKSSDNQNSSSLNSHQYPLTSEVQTNGLNLKFGQQRGGGGGANTGGNSMLLVHGSALSCSVSLESNQHEARKPRNSLQLVTPSTTGRHAGSQALEGATLADCNTQQRANKSLGNIFASQPAPAVQQATETRAEPQKVATSSTTTSSQIASSHQPRAQLTLEPRDRPAGSHTNLILQQLQQQTPLLTSSSASQLVQGHEQPQPATTIAKQTTATTTTTTAAFKRKATSSSELIPRQPTVSARVFQSLEQHQARTKACESSPTIDSEGSQEEDPIRYHQQCSPKWDQSLTEQESNSDSLGPADAIGSSKCCRCDRHGSDASCRSIDFDGHDLGRHDRANW